MAGMTNEAVVRAMSVAIQTPSVGGKLLGLPILLWGPPGVGKTAFVNQIGEALGYHVVTVLASIREPSDFLGLPIPQKVPETGPTGQPVVGPGGRPRMTTDVKMAAPDWARELNRNSDNPPPGAVGQGRKALLFLDEFSTAAPSVQAALLRVIHERVVGDLQLNSNVAVIAAANPPAMSPGGRELDPPTVNRFIHLDWMPPSREAWADYIEGHPSKIAIPRLPSNALFAYWYSSSFAPLGANFIRSFQQPRALEKLAEKSGVIVQPEWKGWAPLFNMPPKAAMSQKKGAFDAFKYAWPSPRSWEIALRAAAGAYAAGAKDVAELMVCGSVGSPLCQQFVAYIAAADLMTPFEYVDQGADPKFRGDMSRISVILTSVTNYGLNTPGKADAAVDWLWENSQEVRQANGWPLAFYDSVVQPEFDSWLEDPSKGPLMQQENPDNYQSVVTAFSRLKTRARAGEKAVMQREGHTPGSFGGVTGF